MVVSFPSAFVKYTLKKLFIRMPVTRNSCYLSLSFFFFFKQCSQFFLAQDSIVAKNMQPASLGLNPSLNLACFAPSLPISKNGTCSFTIVVEAPCVKCSRKPNFRYFCFRIPSKRFGVYSPLAGLYHP